MTRDEMKALLTEKVCEVTFTKANGDTRVMRCTLQDGVVPQATKEDPLSQKKVRDVNEEVLAVWDVEKEGWRSFRLDKVISFNA